MSTASKCRERLCKTRGRDRPHHANLPRASVLVLLFEHDNTVHTLITKRSMKLNSHPGECCFPGGRQDDDDKNNDAQTALREAHEEVGLNPGQATILGRLDSLESVNHLCVVPMIAWMNTASHASWKINPDEVETAFHVPLDFFLTEPESMYEVQWSGEMFYMRTYVYHDKQHEQYFSITGLTAHIAHQVATIAHGVTTNEPRTFSSTLQTHNDTKAFSGYLWKRETSSRGRSYWTKRYFVCNGHTLHHYDNELAAHRKSQSANKKHRLILENCKITRTSEINNGDKYEFVLDAAGGRIQWHLASATSEDRETWVRALVACSNRDPERTDE